MASGVLLWYREGRQVLPGLYKDSSDADAGIQRWLRANPQLSGVKFASGSNAKHSAATIDKLSVTY